MDCASTDFEDTGSDSVEVDDGDVAVDTDDDSSATGSGSGTDSYDDASWDEASEDSDDSGGCGDSEAPDVAASTGTAGDDGGSGDHCASAVTHPSLGDPSLSDPSVPEQVATTTSTSATPAAASAGAPLVALPDHFGVPGETIGSSDGARILTPGVFTPTSFDAAGNATHVSYSGIVAPPTESVTFSGNQTMPASTHPQVLATQALINQTNTDMNTNTLTGVSVDRSGSSPTYYGAGKPFDDFGDALGNKRHPEP
ncbi:hypothetical protein [Actinomycetospora sp. CA-053990]|uniref:hypothetical protein n=1 Tax=Actinomycetospora sp. CA-053990 TaxID=3239891 RepID=UPI003D91FC16